MSQVEQAVRWSYSALKTYQNCQHRYYRQYILKDVTDPGNDATMYGTDMHEAIENHLKDNVPLPDKYKRFEPAVSVVKNFEGDKYIEHEMALDYNLKPCAFDCENRFVRGIADVIIVNGKVARVLDWKSGKSSRYADVKQLELMALMIFKHFPKVDTVKGALAFVVAGDVIKASYSKKDSKNMWKRWLHEVVKIEASVKNGSFAQTPGGLCGFCPVKDCEFNR